MAALAAAAAGRRRAPAAARAALACALQCASLQPVQQQQQQQWEQLTAAASATSPCSSGAAAAAPWPNRRAAAVDSTWWWRRQQQQQPSPASHQLAHWQPLSTQSPAPPPGKQQQQQQQAEQERKRLAGIAALRAAGWSRAEVLNAPNAISLARLLSGPLIASWIVEGRWSVALPALAVSGASDWADGYVARRWNQPSVIGSYLDPFADKVLICCVIAALGWTGTLPPAVVALILGRDAFLLGGGVAARMHFLGWRWPGMAEWCRVQPPPAAAAAAPASAAAAPPALPRLQPLYISKVNTVFQLGLAGACMLDAWLGAPGWSGQLVTAATWLTAGTTAASCAAYVPVLKGVAAGRAPGQ